MNLNPGWLDEPTPPRTLRRLQQRSGFLPHPPAAPQVPARIRTLLRAVYASRGGPERMTLDDWRDVEQEIQKRLKNENSMFPK
jgi:hypothetical protein